ncbi:MAG: ABC transporter substrate-binding protein, partial [Clostridia bacterium]
TVSANAQGRSAGEVTTDAMKLALKATAQNFEDGLMPEDIMTMKLTDYNGKSMLNTVAFAWTTGSGVGTEEQLEETMLVNYGFPTTVIEMSPTYFVGMNYAAGGNCITSTCKNPEAAIKFIDLLCSKKGAEVYNTLVYGIEGVHYEKIDDTHIKTFEYDGSQGGVKTKYSTWKWNIGNTFNAYLNQGCVDGTNEFILNVMHGSQAKVSKLIGLTWDTSVVESELAQMKAIQKEYCKGLTYGVMGSDWEAYFNEYVAKLESADYQKVIDQLQSQVDHFMAGK